MELNAREAEADPFGVGSISPLEFLHALSPAIGSRLADTQWRRRVVQHTEGDAAHRR